MSAQYTKKERVILGVMLLLVLAVLLFVNFFPKYKELFDIQSKYYKEGAKNDN